MREVDQYIEYIEAIRSDSIYYSRVTLLNLYIAGFRPDAETMAQLVEQHAELYNTLFNKSIKIVIDLGEISGHAYIENMPIYDWDKQNFYLEDFGFYPGNNILYSNGQIKDEVARKSKGYPNFYKTLDISQEQWEKLGYWASSFKDNKNKYSVFANFIPDAITQSECIHNCVTTVNTALKEISKTFDLKNIFSPEELSSISHTKHALILHLLGDTKETLTTKCYLEAEYTGTNCDAQVQEQTEKLKETQKTNKKQFIKETIQTLFNLKDPAKDILDNVIAPGIGIAPSILHSFQQQELASFANIFEDFINTTINDIPEDNSNSDSSSEEHERACKKQKKNARI